MKKIVKKQRFVYADHAATTPVDKEVLKNMLPFFTEKFGNPSALYKLGIISNSILNDSRRKIAELIHALPQNIIFTSGGTEANNLAIYGTINHNISFGKHIVTTPIEHHSVLQAMEELKKKGFEITFVKVDHQGFVDPEEVVRAVRKDTILVSIIYANNEIGTIQQLSTIGKSLLQFKKQYSTPFPYFHTDACQAAGYLNLDVEKLHVDLLTLNGSKVYGPKGVGMLYIRKGIQLEPLFYGGNQEFNLRAGTENIPGIVGLAKALELVNHTKEKELKRLTELTSYFWNKLHQEIPNTSLNGPEIGENRLVNNINITFFGYEAEKLLLYLDSYGIMCSTGSACSAASLDPSHVLKAIGLSNENCKSSLRFTFGKSNTKKDADFIIKSLKEILKLLNNS